MYHKIAFGLGLTGFTVYSLRKTLGRDHRFFKKFLVFFFEISLKKRLNPEKASAKSEKKLCVTGFAGRTETMSVLNYLKWRKIDHDFVSIYPLQESGLFIETSVALNNKIDREKSSKITLESTVYQK